MGEQAPSPVVVSWNPQSRDAPSQSNKATRQATRQGIAYQLELSGHPQLAREVRYCGVRAHRTCHKKPLCWACSRQWSLKEIGRARALYGALPGERWWTISLTVPQEGLQGALGLRPGVRALWDKHLRSGGAIGLVVWYDIKIDGSEHTHGLVVGEIDPEQILKAWHQLSGGEGHISQITGGLDEVERWVNYSSNAWKKGHPISAEVRVAAWRASRGRPRVKAYGACRTALRQAKTVSQSNGEIVSKSIQYETLGNRVSFHVSQGLSQRVLDDLRHSETPTRPVKPVGPIASIAGFANRHLENLPTVLVPDRVIFAADPHRRYRAPGAIDAYSPLCRYNPPGHPDTYTRGPPQPGSGACRSAYLSAGEIALPGLFWASRWAFSMPCLGENERGNPGLGWVGGVRATLALWRTFRQAHTAGV